MVVAVNGLMRQMTKIMFAIRTVVGQALSLRPTSLRRWLTNFMTTKLRLYKTLHAPVVINGSKYWTIPGAQEAVL